MLVDFNVARGTVVIQILSMSLEFMAIRGQSVPKGLPAVQSGRAATDYESRTVVTVVGNAGRFHLITLLQNFSWYCNWAAGIISARVQQKTNPIIDKPTKHGPCTGLGMMSAEQNNWQYICMLPLVLPRSSTTYGITEFWMNFLPFLVDSRHGLWLYLKCVFQKSLWMVPHLYTIKGSLFNKNSKLLVFACARICRVCRLRLQLGVLNQIRIRAVIDLAWFFWNQTKLCWHESRGFRNM